MKLSVQLLSVERALNIKRLQKVTTPVHLREHKTQFIDLLTK